MQCSPLRLERVKPLLGTYVSVRVEGLAPDAAAEAVTRCFAEMAEIHRCMSVQEPTSDVTRLNREAHRRAVRVDDRTYEVLGLAAVISRHSHGTFDVTTASDQAACWTDVALLPDGWVSFRRPLRLDLSGIAKGYAVDRAIDILSAAAAPQACVNAGGDLRVWGKEAEWARSAVDLRGETVVPIIELRNESMASSGSRDGRRDPAQCVVTHLDGVSRRPVPTRFVSVVAGSCAVADALTKVVMARGACAAGVLQHFGARAVMSDGDSGWEEVA